MNVSFEVTKLMIICYSNKRKPIHPPNKLCRSGQLRRRAAAGERHPGAGSLAACRPPLARGAGRPSSGQEGGAAPPGAVSAF